MPLEPLVRLRAGDAMRIANALFTIARTIKSLDADDRAQLERACAVHEVTMPELVATPRAEMRGGGSPLVIAAPDGARRR